MTTNRTAAATSTPPVRSQRRRRDARRAQRGSVMILALIALGALVALMVSIESTERIAAQTEQNRLRHRRAELAARSAVARALAYIELATPTSVTLNDDWALLGDSGNIKFDMGDGMSSFRVQVIDENSLINVDNFSTATGTTTPAQLEYLPLTPQQSDSLIDWMTSSQNPRPNGAKNSYYNSLPQPYNTTLTKIDTLYDLLLIQGWTANMLLEPQTDVQTSNGPLEDANGNVLPLIDVLAADPRPNTTAAAYIDRINANTATQTVLETIPGMTTAQAANIVAGQTAGYTSLQQFVRQVPGRLPGVTQPTNTNGRTTPLTSSILNVGSDTWIIRAYGESGGVGVALEVTAGFRSATGTPATGAAGAGAAAASTVVRPVTWNELPNTAVPDWWEWTTPATESADAGDPGETTQ
jgi:type II secretory pathway component PulK